MAELLDLSQRYNLKANHNLLNRSTVSSLVVGFKPKIQFESKSQQLGLASELQTVVGFKPKIQFESKSQLIVGTNNFGSSCWI